MGWNDRYPEQYIALRQAQGFSPCVHCQAEGVEIRHEDGEDTCYDCFMMDGGQPADWKNLPIVEERVR